MDFERMKLEMANLERIRDEKKASFNPHVLNDYKTKVRESFFQLREEMKEIMLIQVQKFKDESDVLQNIVEKLVVDHH